MTPETALSSLAISLAAALALYWPERGLVPRLKRLREAARRVRLEDAVRHLYEYQVEGYPCTLDTLAARLAVSRPEASSVLTELADLGLVRVEGVTLVLTSKGQDSALRLVRSHRLWERYLADRTGLPPSEWQRQAERVEHLLSDAQVEALSHRLGHPTHDPYGRPIPTAEGAMPPPAGVSLFAVEAGEVVEVVRIVDDSPEVVAGLAKRGVVAHSRLEVLERSESSVTVAVRDASATLGHLAASAVVVRRLPGRSLTESSGTTLADLRPMETALVRGISAECQGVQRRRLLDLGMVPGTEITPELESGGGDPVAYRVEGALIALRRQQASWITVEPLARGGEA